MQIVIDIPDYVYCDIQAYKTIFSDKIEEVAKAIKYGTPLPKGHGNLIDGDKLLDSNGIIADSRKCHYIPMIDVYQAPTIIEADKAESEERMNATVTCKKCGKPLGVFDGNTCAECSKIDAIRQEIKQKYNDYKMRDDYEEAYGLEEALMIIDKHIGGTE